MKLVQMRSLDGVSQVRWLADSSRSRRASSWAWLALSMLLILLTACSGQTGGVTPPTTPIALLGTAMPTATPSPTATPDPLLAAKAKVLQIMAGMTLQQKLGQLIVVEYLGNDYHGTGLQYMVTQQYVGGVLYQTVNHNFVAPENTVAGMAAFSQKVQQDAKIPLLLGTDQEGGEVNRLEPFHGPLPSASAIAQTGNPQYAYDQGKQWAIWMQQMGINADLAPVVDVQTANPPLLQSRLFGTTPTAVETYAGAFLNGLQQNGVIGCLKHFPGLGSLGPDDDPHFGLPTVKRDLNGLEQIDLAPYREMIAQYHPLMIMDTDVVTTAIDPTLPAELSPKAINGVLRGQLGYDGVIITDGLYMHGISEHWSIGEAAAMAIIAGNDLVEGPFTTAEVSQVLTSFNQALASGQLTEARIDQSVERVLLMKVEAGIIK